MPPPKRAPKQARKPAEHSHQNGDLHLQAMAQIAVLFDLVDMTRLIAIRDRLFPVPSALSHISAQLAYKEYLRFLAIKILSSDIPALNLSPSWYIDQLWHAHILDTEAYALLRNKWPDRMIHDPLPHPGQEARLKVTRDKYEKLFKEFPLRPATFNIWFDGSSTPNTSTETPSQMALDAQTNDVTHVPSHRETASSEPQFRGRKTGDYPIQRRSRDPPSQTARATGAFPPSSTTAMKPDTSSSSLVVTVTCTARNSFEDTRRLAPVPLSIKISELKQHYYQTSGVPVDDQLWVIGSVALWNLADEEDTVEQTLMKYLRKENGVYTLHAKVTLMLRNGKLSGC